MSLTERYGPAAQADRPPARSRPGGVDTATVAALGKLSEALEVAENARGLLYAFHRLCGTADLTLQNAVSMLRRAGHATLADDIATTLVGRDIIPGHWSFQIVEAYDANYWQVFRAAEAHGRASLGGVPRHLYEAEMKHREQSPGSP